MMLNKHRIYIFHVENIKTGEEKNTNNNTKKETLKKDISCWVVFYFNIKDIMY